MPDYSFSSLSPFEFEHLVRDLLQAENQTVFESFTPGADGGRDARWIDPAGGTTLVQCKHYLQTGYAGLLRALKRERSRVRLLAPSRYIIATSLGLTPNNKDEITQLFAPHCRGPGDVLGRDDLNNRLGLFPDVEHRNVKLWLTSDAVLARVIEGRLFGASAITLDRARRKAQRYVLNASFNRALDMLETRHVCVIAGIPGIGKTTLAEVLLTHYVDRHGFQPYRVTHDLAELDGVRRRNMPQIFYYDDFLGTTGLDLLGKNEDRRLVDFMAEVANVPSWRLVLTTREYILAAAQGRYEALAHGPFDQSTCVIALRDYTQSIRAQILYNHLYFSDLPRPMREALLPGRLYRRVYSHPYYNPRIIETMTSVTQITADTPESYAAQFVAALDDPSRIWRHAYDHQLSSAARNLLLVRGTLPETLLVEDLRVAFTVFHESRHARYGYPITEMDFRIAIKTLDGTFLHTYREHHQTLVGFHNPSVQDFVERRLSEEPLDIRDLASGGAFLEQYRSLWRGRGASKFWTWAGQGPAPPEWPAAPVRYGGVKEYSDDFVDGLERVIEGQTCMLIQQRGWAGDVRWGHNFIWFEERVDFVLEVAQGLQTPKAEAFARRMLNRLAARVSTGDCSDREGLIGLMERIRGGEAPGESAEGVLYRAARSLLVTQLDDPNDYWSVGSLIRSEPSAVTPAERDMIRTSFRELYPDLVSEALRASDPTDAPWVRDLAEQLTALGEPLEMDLSDAVLEITEHADELEGPEPDDDRGWRGGSTAGDDPGLSANEIDQMFEGLRGD